VRYSGGIALTMFFSSSGGMTENIEYAFPGAPPKPYLKGVRDRYDSTSPYHRWTVRLTQAQIQAKLSGLFSGKLKKIRVTKHGVSPRIVQARVVGSRGSQTVSGPTLEYRLGLKSTWARFRRR
jgi:stage II sporulation protein D